jgi:hypothetical protein
MGGKPNPWGIKMYLLCGADLIYNFVIYQGSTTELNQDIQKTYSLGGSRYCCFTSYESTRKN